MKAKSSLSINLVLTLAMTGFICTFNACKEKDDPKPEPPTINSISPTEGKMNAVVTISGTNFDLVPTNNIVKFNGKTATVSAASATQLTVQVPVGAGTGKVSVTTNGITIDGPDFKYFQTVTVSTLAGSGIQGYEDGTGSNAVFDWPVNFAIDAQDNIFLCDRRNNRIRKVTPAGVVTTIAGSGVAGSVNGNGLNAQFNRPSGITIDKQGNLFVSQINNASIRKITPGGDVTTIAGGIIGFADGTGTAAQFNFPASLTIDSQNNLFVADAGNNRVRKVTPDGVVTTFVGDGTLGYNDGTGTGAQVNPWGITIDKNGDFFITDIYRVRKITAAGQVTTIAGKETKGFVNGPTLDAAFGTLYGIVIDKDGNLIITDSENLIIRKISLDGIVSTLAGTGITGFTNGDASIAQFSFPYGLAINSLGNIFVGEGGNFAIRKIVIE